jgi:predicted nucleic acid-binding protein
MIDKVFLDTNILVYAHDATAGAKHERAAALVGDLWDSQTGVISVQVIQEFYVTVTKKVSNPVESKTAERWVSNYLNWLVVENDGYSVLRAIEIENRYQVSFWDALIIQAAETAGVKRLLSEDLNSGQMYGNVLVENPLV